MSLAQGVPGCFVILTDTGRPQTERVRDFLNNFLAVFDLTEKNPIVLDFLDARIDQNFDTVAGEATLRGMNIELRPSAPG